MNNDDQCAYTVEDNDDSFAVKSQSGMTVMVCGDLASAEQYALMLNKAWEAGFKQGVRSLRRPDS